MNDAQNADDPLVKWPSRSEILRKRFLAPLGAIGLFMFGSFCFRLSTEPWIYLFLPSVFYAFYLLREGWRAAYPSRVSSAVGSKLAGGAGWTFFGGLAVLGYWFSGSIPSCISIVDWERRMDCFSYRGRPNWPLVLAGMLFLASLALWIGEHIVDKDRREAEAQAVKEYLKDRRGRATSI